MMGNTVRAGETRVHCSLFPTITVTGVGGPVMSERYQHCQPVNFVLPICVNCIRNQRYLPPFWCHLGCIFGLVESEEASVPKYNSFGQFSFSYFVIKL